MILSSYKKISLDINPSLKEETLSTSTSDISENSSSSQEKSKENINSHKKNFLPYNNLFSQLKNSMSKTRKHFGLGVIKLFNIQNNIRNDFFDKLEEKLLLSDVGIETTQKIINRLIDYTNRFQIQDSKLLYSKLHKEMLEILTAVEQPLLIRNKSPFVILIIGVNGVGKTTTIGKLMFLYHTEGKKVMLAAGDTFRAAASEQIQEWGGRYQIPVIAQQHTGADSAAVIFDAIQSAKARNAHILIIDTAGRLHNKIYLMDELKKIIRVMKKLDFEFPHEIMLIIDASTGQNAMNQVQLFNEAVGITGITITKLDGTAKGGIIFPIADRFIIPIRYIGMGEDIQDLRSFNADHFINTLFSN